MEAPDLAEAIALPPEQAIQWFRQKGYTISWDWQETLQEAHARAFTVARVTRLDTLQTIRSAVDQALAEGRTERWFQKTLTPLLQEAGWWGQEEVEVQPGQTRLVQLGSPRRLQLIFRQNLQTAYMAGRWAEIVRNAVQRPYLMYVAVMDTRTRPSHAAMHRRVYRWDDPIWQWLWPPNGWFCRCRVRALSEAALKRSGVEVESSEGKLRQKMAAAGTDYTTGEVTMIEVTGIRVSGLDGKPITFWPDAGFSYNPGSAGWQPELDKYSPNIARKYVDGMRTGPDFERWFGSWVEEVEAARRDNPGLGAQDLAGKLNQQWFKRGKETISYPVSILDPRDVERLKASTQVVRLSDQSLVEHLVKHPEIGLAEYQRIQEMMDRGEVYQWGDQRLVYFFVDGVRYRAALKLTKGGDELFLLTLFQNSEGVPKGATRVR